MPSGTGEIPTDEAKAPHGARQTFHDITLSGLAAT